MRSLSRENPSSSCRDNEIIAFVITRKPIFVMSRHFFFLFVFWGEWFHLPFNSRETSDFYYPQKTNIRGGHWWDLFLLFGACFEYYSWSFCLSIYFQEEEQQVEVSVRPAYVDTPVEGVSFFIVSVGQILLVQQLWYRHLSVFSIGLSWRSHSSWLQTCSRVGWGQQTTVVCQSGPAWYGPGWGCSAICKGVERWSVWAWKGSYPGALQVPILQHWWRGNSAKK